MEVTTTDRYRVLGRPREESELLLVDREGFDPTYVPTAGNEDDVAATLAALRAGYVVDATLRWADGTPVVEELSVVDRTLFAFCPSVTGLFEAARETWTATEAAGEAMNSRVTRDVDGEPNGVLYVFAEQPGARDLFEEFRTGVTPLDPLVDRVDESRDGGPREVFVMRPADDPFVLVYIVFRKGGVLADTVRDTYDCPRPPEPLAPTGDESTDDSDDERTGRPETADGSATPTAAEGGGTEGALNGDDRPSRQPSDAWLDGDADDPWGRGSEED